MCGYQPIYRLNDIIGGGSIFDFDAVRVIEKLDNHTLRLILHELDRRDQVHFVAATKYLHDRRRTLMGDPPYAFTWREHALRMTAQRSEARIPIACDSDSRTFMCVTPGGQIMHCLNPVC